MTQRTTRLAITAAFALSVAACASTYPKPPPGGSTEMPKPIAVSLVKLHQDIAFTDGRLAPDERQETDLDAFLASSASKGDDHVFVLAGPTGPDGERADILVTRLRARGLAVAAIRDPSQPAGVLRIIVERWVATAPDCPDWSRIAWANLDNLTSSNFGCATSADLAAMVADPHDLIAGRTMGPVVGDPAVTAIERYRAPPGAGAAGGLAGALGALLGGASTTGGISGGGSGP